MARPPRPAAARVVAGAPRLEVLPGIAIPERELHERFIHAGGPGGQNVDHVATAVQLRFDVAASPTLPEAIKRRLRRLAGRRLTAEGVLVIEARRFRARERNRLDARARLVALLRRAAAAPRPRRPTKPSRAVRARRLQAKRARAEVKQRRRPPNSD